MDWGTKDIALLKRLGPQDRARHRLRAVSDVAVTRSAACYPFGPEAWPQAANSKTHDKAAPEAKAGVVGRLHTSGGKEGP